MINHIFQNLPLKCDTAGTDAATTYVIPATRTRTREEDTGAARRRAQHVSSLLYAPTCPVCTDPAGTKSFEGRGVRHELCVSLIQSPSSPPQTQYLDGHSVVPGSLSPLATPPDSHPPLSSFLSLSLACDDVTLWASMHTLSLYPSNLSFSLLSLDLSPSDRALSLALFTHLQPKLNPKRALSLCALCFELCLSKSRHS